MALLLSSNHGYQLFFGENSRVYRVGRIATA